MIGPARPPRILDFANRNVGVGCGNVHIWDPGEHNGTVNSGVTHAGVLPVYGDRGGGDEINGKIEAGLLGITVSPDFVETGPHLPAVLPDLQPGQPGPPGPRRRRPAAHHEDEQGAGLPLHRRPRHQAARPRLRGRDLRVRVADLQLLPPRRRHGLRLRGQPLRHHRRLQLVAAHQRHSGNFQPARCPTGDPDRGLQRPLRQQRHLVQRRAPHRRQHQRLQRQDAALQPGRHDPRRVAADGRRQQHVHAAERAVAERPEPLQRHRGQRQPGQAGDLRDGPAQPVAPVHRPRDRHPVLGVGRPRRRLAVRDPGPVDVRERHPAARGRQLRLALLHGQPAGLPRPRRRRLAAHDQRAPATSPAARPPAPRRAGTTATTSSTTRRTTPA